MMEMCHVKKEQRFAMKALPTLGLRGRLILLLLALFFALVGFSVWQALQDRTRRLDDSAQYLLRSAKLIAARQNNIEAQADAILSSLMLRPA